MLLGIELTLCCQEDRTETAVAIEIDSTSDGQTDRQTYTQVILYLSNKPREDILNRCTDRYWPYDDTRVNSAQNYTFGKMQCQCLCQCQSEFVNVAKIVKLFRSPRKRKTVGKRSNIIAIFQQMTSERGMSLDSDGRQTEKGKTD